MTDRQFEITFAFWLLFCEFMPLIELPPIQILHASLAFFMVAHLITGMFGLPSIVELSKELFELTMFFIKLVSDGIRFMSEKLHQGLFRKIFNI